MAEGLLQITTLPSLGGRPGVKPLVGVLFVLPVVDTLWLGEGVTAFCTSYQFVTLLCAQMPPFGFGFSWKNDKDFTHNTTKQHS